ncbi:MAG: NADH-quinone oxidoreductase subunit 4 [candidate division BRC1 bacterium ADurb.BinA292]|nr:MAG: NADH-quinone oxidoreductase subunit 4 [candidate division BRC1 bacterium ADurb.BinA292]
MTLLTAPRPDTLRTEELLVNMGPQHPSTHGVLRLVVRTDGEIVREAWPQIGFLHRCFEKVAESVTYAQVTPYCDRMDYLASMNNGLAWCLAVERLGGIEVPERAAYLRVMMAELNRIASHLLAFGTYALDLGAFTPFLYGFRERELILSIFEKISGGRLLYHYPRLGGVARDLTPELAGEIRAFIAQMRRAWPEYNELLSENQIFIKRTANVGVIPAAMAVAYGLTGPCLRGSGVKFDLRRAKPYSLYERFDFDIPVGEGIKGEVGDCWDRYWVRMREIIESLRIIEQALDGLPEGEIQTKVSRTLKLPAGEVYVPCENPRGESGYYLISDGKTSPLRVKARGPSFNNLSITHALVRDVLIADVVAIVGSIDIVLGEVDR